MKLRKALGRQQKWRRAMRNMHGHLTNPLAAPAIIPILRSSAVQQDAISAPPCARRIAAANAWEATLSHAAEEAENA